MANILTQRLKKKLWFQKLESWLKIIVLPGFEGVPLYDAMDMFFDVMMRGYLAQRASAIAYNFFLAIFPTILFFFTLIPYIPIHNFQYNLLEMMEKAVPPAIYEFLFSTINDIITKPHTGLLSFGFILTLFFASNGFKSIISAFNTSILATETRTYWQIQWLSMVLILIVSILTMVTIGLIVFAQYFANYLIEYGWMKQDFVFYAMLIGNYIILLALIYFIFSFIYFLAPASKTQKYKFFSAGSSFSTLLFVGSYYIFNYYVENFARYNALYGSIGTLILLMLYIYFNAYILLIGYELNVSIKAGKRIVRE